MKRITSFCAAVGVVLGVTAFGLVASRVASLTTSRVAPLAQSGTTQSGTTQSETPEATQLPLRRVNVPSDDPSSEEFLPALFGLDDQLWNSSSSGLDPNDSEPNRVGDRQALITAIDRSLSYLQTPEAAEAYEQYPIPEFSLIRVRRSLERFRQLVVVCDSAADLQTAVLEEFDIYQSVGTDGMGTVSFTGYFEPVYVASRVPTAEFRYPLYQRPPDLEQWTQPHPTREALEGNNGLQGSQGRLRGLELIWLRDRLEAYLVQVQGSARLQLTDGTTTTVGYAGRTEYPYVSLGRELVNDGKFREEDLSLPVVIQYFRDHPAEMDRYLPRNDRFVFFEETAGSPAIGSLGVPVTAERSIATDKSLMPPGALALIQTQLPYLNSSSNPAENTENEWISRLTSRYVLDQDTGGAIRGAGRVDIFMGTGAMAGDRAGRINTTGQLYYLLLKDDSQPQN